MAGAEEAPLRVLPAHQRLDAPHGAGPDLGLGLVVQHQLAGLQRAVQITDERQPIAAVAVALRQVDLVTGAHPLRLVHRDVGALEQPERGARVMRVDRDADAGVDVDPDAADLEGLLQRRAQPQPCRARRRLVARHQDDRELVAPEPGERVVLAQQRAQAGADLAQHLIARMVAEGVVELLEPVEVDEQQRQLLARLRARGHGRAEPVHEVTAVAEPGQLVGLRLVTALAQPLDDGEPGASHPGQHGDDRERDGDVGDLGELPDRQQHERGRREREDRRQHHGAELGPRGSRPRGQPRGTADEHRRDGGRGLARAEEDEARERDDDRWRRPPPRQRDHAHGAADRDGERRAGIQRDGERRRRGRAHGGVQPREAGHVRVQPQDEQGDTRRHEHAGRDSEALGVGVDQRRRGRARQAYGREQPHEPRPAEERRRRAGQGSRDEHDARGQVEEHPGEMLPEPDATRWRRRSAGGREVPVGLARGDDRHR